MGPTAQALGSALPQITRTVTCFNPTSGKKFGNSFRPCELLRRPSAVHIRFLRQSVGRRKPAIVVRCERNSGETEEKSSDEDKPFFLSADFWLQVAIFLFAAGFVDAGFSGDWSRIGVLTKETEGELQMAAIGVVPLAGTLIWSISQRRKL
ncbi:hypothetical protein MPTK1_3g15380 [Marchantia polymorpha subsp. ruderalis]|uniref:DUF7887 domain-containing protein n=2 Tax=Marchantia polymorpha TaxID=3197 RepID=A0AAF6B126_MARPO|nr:hypothetical protein MARPO_0004s0134 [Marchantia polymorpha]BBN05710.1 hypothetical protein Mp_3g15380 [Marchantia polymorpha subsp. ruderalis]|eukprot:PTQ48871.1 hypothetical protein MARPO_0004s0134 [Marchantia polymorpha]